MKYLMLLMGGLELSDWILTDFLVKDGIVREANRLMESLIMTGDFLSLKIAGAVLSVAALWLVYRKFPGMAVAAASGVSILYGAIMTWNLGIVFSLW
jgi:hypothetical protein